MILTTYAGKSVFLFHYIPDFAAKIDAQFKVIGGANEPSLTNYEEREAMSGMRVSSFRFTAMLDYGESAQLDAALAQLDTRPVLVPFWPSVKLLSGTESPSVTGPLKLFMEMDDLSKWEVSEAASPSGFVPTGKCIVVPLLWGRFKGGDGPKQTAINGLGDRNVSVEVFENGKDYALTARALTLATQVVAGQTVPVLTVPCHWANSSAKRTLKMDSEQIGFGRVMNDSYFPQIPREEWSLSFKAMDGADTGAAARLLGWSPARLMWLKRSWGASAITC